MPPGLMLTRATSKCKIEITILTIYFSIKIIVTSNCEQSCLAYYLADNIGGAIFWTNLIKLTHGL